MTRVLVLNGPNLGTLGSREPEIYGTATLADVERMLREQAATLGLDLRVEQSNHEGRLVDILEEERTTAAACIVNPGALSHTSVTLADALRAFAGPVVEVHISNIHAREPFRRVSLTAEAAVGVITGLGVDGYGLALRAVSAMLGGTSSREATA